VKWSTSIFSYKKWRVRPPRIKILTLAQWAQFQAAGILHGASADGYIQLSAADQLQGTLTGHFDAQKGLVIAKIDLAALGDVVKWEASDGGALFPRIYSPLPMAAVLGMQSQD
jgi:uncharacterized protein (DUF952 family)